MQALAKLLAALASPVRSARRTTSKNASRAQATTKGLQIYEYEYGINSSKENGQGAVENKLHEGYILYDAQTQVISIRPTEGSAS